MLLFFGHPLREEDSDPPEPLGNLADVELLVEPFNRYLAQFLVIFVQACDTVALVLGPTVLLLGFFLAFLGEHGLDRLVVELVFGIAVEAAEVCEEQLQEQAEPG